MFPNHSANPFTQNIGPTHNIDIVSLIKECDRIFVVFSAFASECGYIDNIFHKFFLLFFLFTVYILYHNNLILSTKKFRCRTSKYWSWQLIPPASTRNSKGDKKKGYQSKPCLAEYTTKRRRKDVLPCGQL